MPQTLGVFLASIHTGAANEMWPAILDRAQKRGVNLVCFPGGRLNAADEYEHQRNAVYSLAHPSYLQGLLSWASSIGGMVDKEVLDSFHQHHSRIPMLTLSHQIEGFPVVRIDAYAGMFNLVEHMVKVHGHRRIAFLRGPDNHLSSQDRFNAYRDALETMGIPFDEQLCLGPYPWDGGARAATELLDTRKLLPGTHIDALVGASDLLAFRAMQALQSRGYRIPGDLAVGGFNDTSESRLSSPPMTTVAMPFRIQGETALDRLADMVGGEAIAPVEILPSRLVLRQSCGCHSRNLTLGDTAEAAPWDSGRPWKEHFVAEAQEVLGLDAAGAQAWLHPLAEALRKDLATLCEGCHDAPGRESAFIETLGMILDRSSGQPSLLEWQDLVTLLQDHQAGLCPPEHHGGLESLLHKARVFLADRTQLEADKKHWAARSLAATMQETGRLLLESHSIAELCQVLVDKAPVLGINGVWLVLDGRLRLAWRDKGRMDLGPDGMDIPEGLLLPPEVLPRHRAWALVVEPLYFHEESYGHVIFEAGSRNGSLYEEVRSYLSSAVRGIFLFEEVLAARRIAEKADNIKTRLLANVSHELRSPLNLIKGHALKAAEGRKNDSALDGELSLIVQNADHQLRVVNDLLDLTRAEIDELDLHRELVDLAPLLAKVFEDFHGSLETGSTVEWRCSMAPSLPLVWADTARIRQIVLNLLSNARRHTSQGSIELGAAVDGTSLHFWVRDTGSGISLDQQERVFEPFVSGVNQEKNHTGIGLGLSITRHMIVLHGGQLSLESEPGKGSTFHVRIPLPSLATDKGSTTEGECLVVISQSRTLPPHLAELCEQKHLEPLFMGHLDDIERLDLGGKPALLAWDLAHALPSDWILIRRLRQHPALFQAPFLVFGTAEMGSTGLVQRGGSPGDLLAAIEQCCPQAPQGSLFVVDDDQLGRETLVGELKQALPDQMVRSFPNGMEALEAMESDIPGLVILDYVMPRLSGADVLDRMRADPRLRHVPVMVMSNKVFDQNDIRRLEGHARVVLQNKGIWTSGETSEAVARLLHEGEPQTAQTSALVKRAILYLNQHYTQSLSRWQVADAINVSEDYLSRVFHRELAISPWEYLNRYRVWQAGRLLVSTTDSIRNIALSTGFSDQAYFSRVFRKITGMSPQEFRQKG